MPTASAPQPSQNGPEDRGPALISMFLTWTIITILFVVARVRSRLMQRYLGIDDYCMLAATATFAASTILVVIIARNGGFQHLYYVDANSLVYVLKLYYVTQPIITVSQMMGKISIAFLLLRIMGMTKRWKTWSLYITIALTIVTGTITCFTTFFQCRDPRALWDPTHFPNVKCWDPMVQTSWSMFNAAWYTFVDFFLALFPILIVRNLHMGWKKKLAVCVLLGLGTVTGILSSLKTRQIYALSQRSDGLWTSYLLCAFVGGELFLMITLGSVPAIRPIFDTTIRLVMKSERDVESEAELKKSKGSKDRKRFKPNKTKPLHPLDIPPSLLNSSAFDTITSVHGGNEGDCHDPKGIGPEQSSKQRGNNEVKVIHSFEVV